MKIALVGYGKMGRMIHGIAEKRNHTVALTVDAFQKDASLVTANPDELLSAVKSSAVEGIIEFSHPSAVLKNITTLLPLSIPIVVGTTGWKEKLGEVESLAASVGGTLVHSSNFSIGVNIFYKIVEEAVKLLSPYNEYDIATWEMHHNQKADSPSGTALEIANRIILNSDKEKIISDAFHAKPENCELHVSSTRCGSVPGTHTVFFDSSADTIELTHRARNREGFALGAVVALEKLSSLLKTGTLQKGKVYTLQDLF